MSEKKEVEVSEEEAMEVAESSRQKSWQGKSFIREVFMGRLPVDMFEPYPVTSLDRPGFVEFCQKMRKFLEQEVDSGEIDRNGKYPEHVVDTLKEMGAFGMKIPEKYDGLGFSQPEYSRALELVGRYDSNIVALLSAHQSIGVPQPIKLFGTEEQKQKYLPWCATTGISAFALTEEDVGSDPARLTTSYEVTDDGDYILNGEKLWCTNGTFADLMVVMARNADTGDISAFVVENDWEGVETRHRCRFMGLRAIENGVIGLDDVRVPGANLIGEEGDGLKIALVTLNTGRLSLPAAAIGGAKKMLEICRDWASKRVQWGAPVGKHEAVAHMISDITTKTFAMESISYLASELATDPDYDIRLAAAASKEWNSTRQWQVIDTALQVRGGRGYETEHSLEARGEEPIPVERAFRDSRINKIFEGSSEIMHLFIGREGLDEPFQEGKVMMDPDASIGEKAKALPGLLWFMVTWYASMVIGWSYWPQYSKYGDLAKHLRFAHRSAKKLGRQYFYGILRFNMRFEKKQAFIFRGVDIANQLFAMVATVCRAKHLADEGVEYADQAGKIADVFCRESRIKIDRWFDGMWNNNDVAKYKLAQDVLEGECDWLSTAYLEMDGYESVELPGRSKQIEEETSQKDLADPKSEDEPVSAE